MNTNVKAPNRNIVIMAVSLAAFCILSLASYSWQEPSNYVSYDPLDGFAGVPLYPPWHMYPAMLDSMEYCRSLDKDVPLCTCPDKNEELRMVQIATPGGVVVEGTGKEMREGANLITVTVGEATSLNAAFFHNLDEDMVLHLDDGRRTGWNEFSLTEHMKFEIHVLRDDRSGNVPALYWPSSNEKQAGELWGMGLGKTLGKVVLRDHSGRVFFQSAPFKIEVVMPVTRDNQ